MLIAVLTGDIVNSSDLAPQALEEAFAALRRASEEIAEWQGVPTLFTRYRGDGWQMMLTKPRLALRASLKIMAAVQSISEWHATRVAVATGQGELRAGETLASAGGEAFVASGRALDKMDSRVHLVSASGGKEGALYRLADYVARGWTPAQSRAVEPLLSPQKPMHSEVAQSLGISRQAVEKALAGAGFGAIEHSLNYLEATDD